MTSHAQEHRLPINNGLHGEFVIRHCRVPASAISRSHRAGPTYAVSQLEPAKCYKQLPRSCAACLSISLSLSRSRRTTAAAVMPTGYIATGRTYWMCHQTRRECLMRLRFIRYQVGITCSITSLCLRLRTCPASSLSHASSFLPRTTRSPLLTSRRNTRHLIIRCMDVLYISATVTSIQ